MLKRSLLIILVCMVSLALAKTLNTSDGKPEMYYTNLVDAVIEQRISFKNESNESYLNEIFVSAYHYGKKFNKYQLNIYCSKNDYLPIVPTYQYLLSSKDFENLKENPKIIPDDNGRYTDYKEPKWVKISLPQSIKVGKKFAIGLDLNSSKENGIMIGLDKKASKDLCNTYHGAPFVGFQKLPWKFKNHDIMVKAVLGKNPTKKVAKPIKRNILANSIQWAHFKDPKNVKDLNDGVNLSNALMQKLNINLSSLTFPASVMVKFRLKDFDFESKNLADYEIIGIRAMLMKMGAFGKNRDEGKFEISLIDKNFKTLTSSKFSFWNVRSRVSLITDYLFEKPFPLEKAISKEDSTIYLAITPLDEMTGNYLKVAFHEPKSDGFASMFSSLDPDTLNSFVGIISHRVMRNIESNEHIIKLCLRKKAK